MATNPASTGPTRRISGSLSPATWHSSLTTARRCCCLPAMSWWRTELATVGAWLETCRPRWCLSSSEPIAFRIRPAREVAIAMTREDRCGDTPKARQGVVTQNHRQTGDGALTTRGRCSRQGEPGHVVAHPHGARADADAQCQATRTPGCS